MKTLLITNKQKQQFLDYLSKRWDSFENTRETHWPIGRTEYHAMGDTTKGSCRVAKDASLGTLLTDSSCWGFGLRIIMWFLKKNFFFLALLPSQLKAFDRIKIAQLILVCSK